MPMKWSAARQLVAFDASPTNPPKGDFGERHPRASMDSIGEKRSAWVSGTRSYKLFSDLLTSSRPTAP